MSFLMISKILLKILVEISRVMAMEVKVGCRAKVVFLCGVVNVEKIIKFCNTVCLFSNRYSFHEPKFILMITGENLVKFIKLFNSSP